MVHPAGMGRRLRVTASVSIVLAIAGVAGGCGEDAPTDRGVTALQSAWLAQPIPVGDDLVQAAVRTCRANDSGLIPLTSTAVLADVRGGGRIAVVFSGPREQVFLCLLRATTDGKLSWSSGWGGDRHSAEGPLAVGEVRPEEPQPARVDAASGIAQPILTATGRVGRGVAGVDLILGSGARVRATTAAGWYAAWWPNDIGVTGYQALNSAGTPLGPVQH
jgi:hypothetical protein